MPSVGRETNDTAPPAWGRCSSPKAIASGDVKLSPLRRALGRQSTRADSGGLKIKAFVSGAYADRHRAVRRKSSAEATRQQPGQRCGARRGLDWSHERHPALL